MQPTSNSDLQHQKILTHKGISLHIKMIWKYLSSQQ